jgi:hypothetical protein
VKYDDVVVKCGIHVTEEMNKYRVFVGKYKDNRLFGIRYDIFIYCNWVSTQGVCRRI